MINWCCISDAQMLKGHISCYKDLLLKSGFDSFRIYAVKSLMIKLYKILEGMTPTIYPNSLSKQTPRITPEINVD